VIVPHLDQTNYFQEKNEVKSQREEADSCHGEKTNGERIADQLFLVIN